MNDGEWRALSADVQTRIRAVREFAAYVLGRDAADRWLAACHPGIRDGSCVPATACESTEGFIQSMMELVRLSEWKRAAAEARLRADLDLNE